MTATTALVPFSQTLFKVNYHGTGYIKALNYLWIFIHEIISVNFRLYESGLWILNPV